MQKKISHSSSISKISLNLKISAAFTLLELLLVVFIIGIIVWSIGKIFSYKDVDRMDFDSCYVTVYGKLDKFFQESLSQKWIYTGGIYKTPNFYDIIIDKTNQKIQFLYSGLDTKVISFYGTGKDDINKCYSPTYHTFISWDITRAQIKAGLQVDTSTTEHSPMELYSGNELLPAYKTWVVYFYYCDHLSNINCLQKYKIEIDPRSYMFKSYFCKKLWTGGKCEVRSE